MATEMVCLQTPTAELSFDCLPLVQPIYHWVKASPYPFSPAVYLSAPLLSPALYLGVHPDSPIPCHKVRGTSLRLL